VVGLSGQNFTANSYFIIYFGTTVVASGQVTASKTINASFIVPSLARGQYQVTVTTNAPDTSNAVIFTIMPEIGLGISSGSVGTQVAVSGRGFSVNSRVTLLFDGSILTTVQTSANGSFSNVNITVPASVKGIHTISGIDVSGFSGETIFSVFPSITVTPTSVAIGDQIAIKGDGFAATSNITIYWDGVSVGAVYAITNASGSFTLNFTIPASSRGQHTVKATDASANLAFTILAVIQKITLNPTTGSTGDTVTITGTGFSADKTISVLYDGTSIATTPTSVLTDSGGSFNASFVMPAGRTGTHRVNVSDGTNIASADLVVVVKVTISPVTSVASPGHVDMELTINGIGFKPNATVSVRYADKLIATTTTDANGNFLVTFTIPPSPAGQHTITVTDELTVEHFSFFMESTPPPVPVLLLPGTGATVDQPVHFVWQAVSDPSGVTYVLQVARDPNFIILVLQQEGLTVSEYTLTEQQKLESVGKNEPYYWRVKAIDGATNESGWALSSPFYVGFVFELSGWILYTVIGLGSLLLLAIGYLLGKRLAL